MCSLGFLIAFESRAFADTHWHIHNWIREYTYIPTKHQKVQQMLELDTTGIYRLRNGTITGLSHRK